MSSFTGMKFSLGGSKPSNSSSNKLSFQPKKPSSLGKRPIAALHDDSDSDDDHAPREVALTGFDEKGAVAQDRTPEKPVLVIPKLEKEDWREQVRKRRRQAEKKQGKNLLPPEEQRRRDAEAKGLMGEEGKIEKASLQYGLQTLAANESHGPGISGDARTEPPVQPETHPDPAAEEPPKQKTDDEIALDRLLGRSSSPKRDLVIPQDSKTSPASDDDEDLPTDPREIYKRQIAAAPEPSTLEDYERIPVEEFGAALLRGMGWDGVKKEGRAEVKRRPNLLGLGAKELKGAEELGAWVQKADVKRLNNSGRGPGKERRETTSQYREREARERQQRSERNGGSSYRDDRREHRPDDRDRRDDRSSRDSRDSRDYRRDDRDRDRRR